MFWRERGWNDDEDAVEARDGAWSMAGNVDGAMPSQFERHVSGLRPEGAMWAPGACDGVSVSRGASWIAGTGTDGRARTGTGLGRLAEPVLAINPPGAMGDERPRPTRMERVRCEGDARWAGMGIVTEERWCRERDGQAVGVDDGRAAGDGRARRDQGTPQRGPGVWKKECARRKGPLQTARVALQQDRHGEGGVGDEEENVAPSMSSRSRACVGRSTGWRVEWLLR